jgi:hypothetical protein
MRGENTDFYSKAFFCELLFFATELSANPSDCPVSEAVLRIRIRIRMFLGLLDPDPSVRGMDPDPALDLEKYRYELTIGVANH